MVRVRMGSYWTAKRLAKAKMIDEKWSKICPFCMQETPETDVHMILKCPKWEGERVRLLGSLRPRTRHESGGLSSNAILFITGLLSLDPVETYGLYYQMLEGRISGLLADPAYEEERLVQWNYDIATMLARFLARVSPKRFRHLDKEDLFLKVDPTP